MTLEILDEWPSVFRSYGDLNDCHGVIAKNIHYFDRQFVPTRNTLFRDTGQFQRAIFPGSERLPFILKNVIALGWIKTVIFKKFLPE